MSGNPGNGDIPNPFAWATGGFPNDPLFADVVLLLHCDNPDGSAAFIDSSHYAHVMVANGGAVQRTVAAIFGAGGLNLSAADTGTQLYVTTPVIAPGSELDILSGSPPAGPGPTATDFTIEGWFEIKTQVATASLLICDYGNDLTSFGGSSGMIITARTSGVGEFTVGVSELPGWTSITANAGLTLNVRHHWAVVRYGRIGTLYLDGIASGTPANNWTGYAGVPANAHATFGWSATVSSALDAGYLDEVRVTKGFARYTANFTPPVGPFPNL